MLKCRLRDDFGQVEALNVSRSAATITSGTVSRRPVAGDVTRLRR